MRRVDVASAIGKFLAAPPERGRLWRGASRLIADVLESLDQERLGGLVKGALAGRLRENNVAPALGSALTARSEERRVGKECVSRCISRWSPYHSKTTSSYK